MAKHKGDPRARLAQAETKLQMMRIASQKANLSEGASEFETNLVSFLALVRSCVTMNQLSRPQIQGVVDAWDNPADKAVFDWLRQTRDQALKEGVSILKIRMEYISEIEFLARFPRPPGLHPAYSRINVAPPGTPPTMHGVNAFELDVNGVWSPALETCRQCLDLVRRFLDDAKV